MEADSEARAVPRLLDIAVGMHAVCSKARPTSQPPREPALLDPKPTQSSVHGVSLALARVGRVAPDWAGRASPRSTVRAWSATPDVHGHITVTT